MLSVCIFAFGSQIFAIGKDFYDSHRYSSSSIVRARVGSTKQSSTECTAHRLKGTVWYDVLLESAESPDQKHNAEQVPTNRTMAKLPVA
jgi:hypothetical protein